MKNIKIAFTLLLIMLGLTLFAQRNRYQEITEKRIEYIAPRLALSAQEAQQFWPLYREFYNEREKLSEKSKIKNEKDQRERPGTEEEYLNAIQFMIESKINQANLLKEFNNKYLEVMSAKKVFKLYQLDDEFNRKLLNQLKNPKPRGSK